MDQKFRQGKVKIASSKDPLKMQQPRPAADETSVLKPLPCPIMRRSCCEALAMPLGCIPCTVHIHMPHPSSIAKSGMLQGLDVPCWPVHEQ